MYSFREMFHYVQLEVEEEGIEWVYVKFICICIKIHTHIYT